MNAPLSEAVRRALAEVTLDDKWTLDRGRAYMSGTQALIRLAMLQRQRDQLAGLNTAGFISGYRGSPLGGVDQTAWKAKQHLERHHVRFQPGLNEDLAATSVWGTQQVNMFEGAKYDGVFAMWYGKGPGVDRCGDVFKHANAAGTSQARRRAGARRRRSWRQVVDAASPVGSHLQGLHDAGAVSGDGAGVSRPRPARHLR